jgi:hypothetical protein
MPARLRDLVGASTRRLHHLQAWEHAKALERRAIARGQELFNTREFVIDNVGGLNGAPEDPVGTPLRATCTICHDTPNAGNHSISMPLNIGLTAAARRTPDLPLYTLRNKATFETVQTTDPGGPWSPVNGPT